uniref:Uncharacterized protein n=1 Tax=uncultured prokaryote TaxID=198431 RepID=A0A0H5QNS3_9ZZZZ|nr:hypothetical protein [uncultured prokaryote]
MDLNEVLVDWSVENTPGGLSVMYFAKETELAIQEQREQIGGLYFYVKSYLAGNTTMTVRTEGRVVDSETGMLTGSWTDATGQSVTGTGGDPVPNVCQGLIRWNTGQVVNGRFLKGKTYVPGLASAAMMDGEVLPACQTAFAVGLDSQIGSGFGPVVWHRPKDGAGGEFRIATTGSLWKEFAVQSGRR